MVDARLMGGRPEIDGRYFDTNVDIRDQGRLSRWAAISTLHYRLGLRHGLRPDAGFSHGPERIIPGKSRFMTPQLDPGPSRHRQSA